METSRTKANHMTAHLLFTVSDRVHEKSEESGKYEGGRSYVDFPIIVPMKLLSE